MLGFIGFLLLVAQVSVSVLIERMFILGRNGEECRKSPAYCFFFFFFEGSDGIYFANLCVLSALSGSESSATLTKAGLWPCVDWLLLFSLLPTVFCVTPIWQCKGGIPL